MAKKKTTRNTYGEGSIFFSNVKQKWMAQVVVGKDANGKAIRKSVIGKTKEEVSEKLTKIKYDLYAGKFVSASNVTFSQLMTQILKEKLAMNEIKSQTYYRHLETLKQFKPINDIPIQKIDSVMIKQLLIDKVGYSQSTIRKIYLMLSQCFKEAVKQKIITENPMDDIKKPRSSQKPRKIRAFTLDEQIKFIDALKREECNYADQMLISILTGMRMGEVNALTIDDINTTFNFINVDKTVSKGEHGEAFINNEPKTEAGNRQVPINSLVKPVIDEILDFYKPTDDKLLFHTPYGAIITTHQVGYEFKRILKKYNIVDPTIKGDITLHSLRHTYATRCIESGMPPKVLQKLLGHTDIKITLNTYSDVFDNFQSISVEQADKYLQDSGIKVG